MAGFSPHNEFNVYESAEARFEVAAKKLGLEDGVYRFMRYPNKEITVYIPVTLDSGQLEVFIGYRVHHSLVRGPVQGRHSLCARRDPGRSASPGQRNDLEMRGREYPVWRSQRRRHLRPVQTLARRTRTHHPAIHRRIERVVRPGAGRSRAGPGHQRASHGLGHGYLFDARAAHHHRSGHRANRSKWAARKAAAKPPAAG